MTMDSHQSYSVGDELQHYAGDRWRVVAVDLPGDGGWHANMIELAGDYRIECIEGRERGRLRRVHADYLEGDGWRLAVPHA
jgi:hypothetical protein